MNGIRDTEAAAGRNYCSDVGGTETGRSTKSGSVIANVGDPESQRIVRNRRTRGIDRRREEGDLIRGNELSLEGVHTASKARVLSAASCAACTDTGQRATSDGANRANKLRGGCGIIHQQKGVGGIGSSTQKAARQLRVELDRNVNDRNGQPKRC